MSTKHRKLPKKQTTNLVLWGNYGNSAAAVLFLSEIRSLGIAVKLVGLGGTKVMGTYGITIHADITLSQALLLASQATYIILPFDSNTLQQYAQDPRLLQLLKEAHEHGATFIESERLPKSSSIAALLKRGDEFRILTYPRGEELYGFIQELKWPESNALHRNRK